MSEGEQHSQHDEEKHILEWFDAHPPQHRRFLDIGAYDGVILSNTRRLFEHGWGGVCVEPAAGPFRKLMENYLDAGSISLVNAAVGAWSGLVKFSQGDDMVSSYDEEHLKKWEGQTPLQETYVMMITVAELLGMFPPPYDFLNLDTEGTNLLLIEKIPFDRLGASLVCIEYDGQPGEVARHLAEFGFREIVYKSNENLIVGRE